MFCPPLAGNNAIGVSILHILIGVSTIFFCYTILIQIVFNVLLYLINIIYSVKMNVRHTEMPLFFLN